MRFLAIIEFAVLATLFMVVVTQLIVPLWKGRPIFPMFRRTQKLEHELDIAREGVDEARLKREIAVTRKEAEKLEPRNPR